MENTDLYDPEYYRAGLFYANKNDSKVWVPIGNGYTLNYANRWSYLLTALFAGLFLCLVIFAVSITYE